MALTRRPFDLARVWLAMQSADDNFNKALGQRIAILRKERRISQVTFSADLGIAQQTLSNYEGGQLRCPVELLPKMSDLLGVSLEELITGQSSAQRPGKRGPVSRLQQQLSAIEALPKSKQKAVSFMLDALIAQHGGHVQTTTETERRTG
jgi:transcriptional regulator with XRE-family HTH domain